MYDEFARTRIKRILTRKLKTASTARFSPSYGVHRGKIPDPNWPPTEFPAEGVAMQRKDKRVTCDFIVVAGKRRVQVHGDLSRGGAKFYLMDKIAAPEVTIELKKVKAQATILSTSQQAKGVAHHVKFISREDGAKLWDALLRP